MNRISVVSFLEEECDDISKYSVQNKLAYCRKHDYNFNCFDKITNNEKSIQINKLIAVNELLKKQQCDWVWLVDIDSVIMNFEFKLEFVLDEKNQMIFTKSKDSLKSCFFKNTQMVREFIDEICSLNFDHSIQDRIDYFTNLLFQKITNEQKYNSITKFIDERICNSNWINSYQQGDFLIQFSGGEYTKKVQSFFSYLLPKQISIVLLSSDENIIEYQKSILNDPRYIINYYCPKLKNNAVYYSFSSLINESTNYVDDEFIIFVNPKSIPNKDDVDTIIKHLHLGYAIVNRIGFGLFGVTKELFRNVGLLDERFISGEYEDNDFAFRLKLSNLAVFSYYDVSRYMYDNMKSRYDKLRGISSSIFHQKWKLIGDSSYKINKKDLDIKKPFNKNNIKNNIKFYWNDFSNSMIDTSYHVFMNAKRCELIVDDNDKTTNLVKIKLKIRKTNNSIFIEYTSDVNHSELLSITLLNVNDPKLHNCTSCNIISVNRWWGMNLQNDVLYELRLFFKDYMLYSNVLKDDLDANMEYNVFI